MKQQRGGTLVGFIIGLVVGLAVALGVAVYVTKVPIPFMNKGQTRSADQDAAEEKKNKDWDPNAPLYGKNPAKAGEKEGEDAEAAKPAEAKPDAEKARQMMRANENGIEMECEGQNGHRLQSTRRKRNQGFCRWNPRHPMCDKGQRECGDERDHQ